MKLHSLVKKTTDFIFDKCSKDVGAVLIWTTIAGWIASSAAQIIGIRTNSKYSNEQKKFMTNQELGDAAVNILSYCILTMPLKKLSTKLVSTGKIIPNNIRKLIIRNGDGKRLGKLDFNIADTPYFSGIEKSYNSFNNFMSTSAAVVGGTIASNIVTPILRNRFASHRQNVPLNKPYSNTNKPSPFDRFRNSNKLSI